MVDSLKIISSNCQGLNSKRKRQDVFRVLKEKQANIYCLQDTHFTKQIEKDVENEWGYKLCHFSSYKSNARGVAIMFHDKLDYEIIREEQDNKFGNYLALK